MKWKLPAALALLAAASGGAFLWLTQARALDAASLPAHEANAVNGELIYHIGGCISCHKGGNAEVPSGGMALKTPVGTFHPPNLTPDAATGLGSWTPAQFLGALQHGVSPQGTHYIPAFPYTSYHRMKAEDALDLFAYLRTLTPVKAPAKPAEITLEWPIRRAMGIWKRLALKPAPADDPAQSASWNRGRYLVQGPGHCGECHTPRNLLMISDDSRALSGAPHPEGKGRVPSLRGLIARGKYQSADDLADALSMGEMGGYDGLASGGMGEVQTNISKLPPEDIRAIAEYLASLQ